MLFLIIHILLFVASFVLLSFSSKWLVSNLFKVSFFLKVREFVVGFFIMAFAASAPNFFVGLVSAFNKVPQLSFGDVIGGNIVDLTLIIGLAALLSRGGLSSESRTVQGTSIFTIIIAVLPLFLIIDQKLSRPDGLVLILSFIIYIFWLFSKNERFSKIYEHETKKTKPKYIAKNLFFLLLSVILLLVGSEGVVVSASYFSKLLNLPISLIGLFVVGLGNCLPEAFFSIQAARRGQDWMVLGDLMGGVVITATLVLGIVALICPITIVDFSPFAIARLFMVISALLFIFCLKTDNKISKKEGIFLLLLYILFLVTEILT